MSIRPRALVFALSALVVAPDVSAGDAPGFNYAEALQKTLYFLEAQQSGKRSPNNRVAWRGDACLTDGRDIGRDLSGGWYDAGDHWTANLTMAFTALTLAWSAGEHPNGWTGTGQMDELLESLIHVNDYFLRCVLNPDCADPAKDLDVVIGCGGREGIPGPSVHAMWAAAEVAHLMTNRPTLRVNAKAPAGDIPGGMAAAMAASARIIRTHGAVLKGKRGFATFDPAAYAKRLREHAMLLWRFAEANAGPEYRSQMTTDEKDALNRRRTQALRSDGQIVHTGYRAGPYAKLMTAAAFLALDAPDQAERERWLAAATALYDGAYRREGLQEWWKDYGHGNVGKLGVFALMRLLPADLRFHRELQQFCVKFLQYRQTPGGLRLREWHAHEYGSLRHANNAATIVLYYSRHVADSPAIADAEKWRGKDTPAVLAEVFAREARRQVDYALGANPYGRSYLVGFGERPFNHPHHRGAFGAWAGFDHFIPGKADDRGTCRHMLYGALIAGPDHNDVFLSGKERRLWLNKPAGNDKGVWYRFANRTEPVFADDYRWDANDQPHQDVMDSQFNEVALDYNAGFMANLAFLCAAGHSAGKPLPDAQFPPPDERNDSLDLKTTDREFFVSARTRSTSATGVEIDATVHNRSRWLARVIENLSFRYVFTLDGDVTPAQVQVNVSGPGKTSVGPVVPLTGKQAYVAVHLTGERMFPGNQGDGRRSVTLRLSAPTWDASNDWSHQGLDGSERLVSHLPVYDGEQHVGGEQPPH
jgi:endoglucanase